MAGSQKPDPQEVPRSPSGRIPRWVMDEAAGRPATPVPFRAGPSLPPRRPGNRVPGWVIFILVLSGVSVLLVASHQFGLGPIGSGSFAAQDQDSGPPLGPPLGYEESGARLADAPPPVVGADDTHFRIQATQADGVTPVTWSPCRPIHYVVRPANTPPGGASMIASSFAAVAAATGLVSVDEGSTIESPLPHRDIYLPDLYGDRWAPVLVAWATPEEVPDFGVDVAGEAGPARVVTDGGDEVYVSGVVYLDPAKFARASAAIGSDTARTVVMHELGHLVGLAHVNDPKQIMWPQQETGGPVRFGSGDLAGLAALGQGPCRPAV